jgi:hypothetical protein
LENGFPFFLADDAKKIDDRWQISGAVTLYNDNRARTIISSLVIGLDEYMSVFRPQTKMTGNIPHLSYVLVVFDG